MNEEELEKKNKRVESIKNAIFRFLKFLYILAILTYLRMGIWNKVMVQNLGVDHENWEPQIFLPGSLVLLMSVRVLNRFWLSLIDLWGITLYAVLIGAILFVI